MSRIGKKPIPLPSGVKYTVAGQHGRRRRPQGQGRAGHSCRHQARDQRMARCMPSARATRRLQFTASPARWSSNAIEGVTKGWSKDLDIVGIGYRAELKGKNTVVFTLGFSHQIEFPLPTGITAVIDPEADAGYRVRHRPPEGWAGRRGHALAAQARSVQEQGRALLGREAEEEGRQDRSEVNRKLKPNGAAGRLRC